MPGKGGSKGKRAQRATSNVFSMFTQEEIQMFKEAFQLMDANHDDIIDRGDLKATYSALGKIATDQEVDDMLADAKGSPVTFTMFLTIFGEKIAGAEDDSVVAKAFRAWDEDGSGMLDEDKLKNSLMNWGDKFTEEEYDIAMRDAPIYEKDGKCYLDYAKFAKIITGSKLDDDEEE